MTDDIDEVSVVSPSLHRSTIATDDDETNRKRSSHMNHQYLLESSLAYNLSTSSKTIAAKIPTNEANTTIITTASQRHYEDDNHVFVRSPIGDGFWHNNKFYSTDGNVRGSRIGSGSTGITAGTFATISTAKHQDDTLSPEGMTADDECVAIATTASAANGGNDITSSTATTTMTTPSKTNKRKSTRTTPVQRKRWKKEAGKPKHPLTAYNLFFYIYRQRWAELMSGNKHNDKGHIDSRYLQSPSTIISEDDISFYFGPTDEDCCYDEIVKARPKRNINMSFSEIAQKVSVAWRTIDASSKNNLQQRAKWNQLQYCLKLSRWQEMKQIAPETPTNFVNLNSQWDASASSVSTSTDNAFYAEMHDPTTSSSTTPKTKHTAQQYIPSKVKYASMVAEVARNDPFQFTKSPLDMSASVLFDESKIENEFDDELSFKSSGTNNTNVTFQNTKVPATIRLAGTGPLDPQLDRTDRHHNRDTDTLCSTGTRLRHVTPEPIHQPEMCARDFQQNLRSFVPTKRMEPSLMEQQQAFRQGDNTGTTLQTSLDNCYVPSNEGQLRQDAGNVFRNNVAGQRIIPTNQRMNQFQRNTASGSHRGIFQSMIVPPTLISNRELGEAQGNHSHSSSSTINPIGAQSLSSHRYRTIPIQSLVQPSLALSWVCLTNSLVKLDDAISSFYTAYSNHEQLYNTTGSPNNHYTNQRADAASNPASIPLQSEIYPCTSCSCMSREHGHFGLDDPNPHSSSRTNISYNWPSSSRRVPNKDAMNFAKSDGRTESNDGQDPHFFEM